MSQGTKYFPETTIIKDFAYTEDNPLRYGDFKHGLSDPEQEDEDLEDDEYSIPMQFVKDQYQVDYEYNEDFQQSRTSGDEEDEDGEENMEINQQAVALFDFVPENDNEVALTEGQVILISYRHGQGWLVAEDPNTGENGLVPEEYVEILPHDVPKPFRPEIFGSTEEEWVDTDYDSQEDNDKDIEKGVENLSV